MRAVHQNFFRNAAAQDAGAADAVAFDDRHLGAVFGGHARGPDAARTGADDDQIVVELGHRPCSRLNSRPIDVPAVSGRARPSRNI